MADYARAASVAPAVVSLAREIVLPAGRRELGEKVQLVRRWLDSHLRWIPDPLGAEYLVPPLALLARIESQGMAGGDCDDMAMLGAALVRAVGIPARLRAVAFVPSGRFVHVYAEGWNGAAWQDLDISRPARGARTVSRALSLGV